MPKPLLAGGSSFQACDFLMPAKFQAILEAQTKIIMVISTPVL